MPQLKQFLTSLANYQGGEAIFNPWRDYDPVYDCDPQAPAVRLRQLEAYLAQRIKRAKYVLVAEAVSYQGGKFSGIPMTSERILLGNQKDIPAAIVLADFAGRRTSCAETAPSQAVKRLGYGEPTATIVWRLLQELAISPFEVLLWNIFPFHPFKIAQGRLSNRTPKNDELKIGFEFLLQLETFLSPENQIIAVGQKAATTLGEKYPAVRHPAQGGARLFREQLSILLTS